MTGRILVTGPRVFKDYVALWNALEALQPMMVIHGEAEGADTFAGRWAEQNQCPVRSKPYSKLLGRAGGVLRNEYLLDHYHPDLVLACRTMGADVGTRDCMARAIDRYGCHHNAALGLFYG